MKDALIVENLTKYYPIHHGRSQRAVFSGLNLTVCKGEKWGIMGRNGAGKSTFIRIISGSEDPTEGQVIRGMSVSWPLAFGGAFQGSLTGKDNVRLISRLYDTDYHRALAYVEEFAELGQYLGEPVKSYSSGMQSRLAFAISMAIEFDCYLIDEILAVGDHRFTEKCKVDLFEKRADRALLLVSHSSHTIREHCNRAAVLADGMLETFTDVEEAIERYESL